MKYPIYIPSLGRWNNCKTAELLESQDISFHLVVEKNEYNNYCKYYDSSKILKMKSSNYGSVSYARNFCIKHSKNNGFEKHWQIDDDIKSIYHYSGGKIINKDIKIILSHVESFSDKYSNLAISSIN